MSSLGSSTDDVNGMVPTVEPGSLDHLRTRLVARLRGATEAADWCKGVLAQPFSNSQEWTQKLEGARGYQRGIAHAIELIDEVSGNGAAAGASVVTRDDEVTK